MEIGFESRRLEKVANSYEKLVLKFGMEVAEKINNRLTLLFAVPDLSHVPVTKPFRRHKLSGDRKNHFAVTVKDGLRIIFKPHFDIENTDDIRNITSIIITEIGDYH